MQWFDVDKSGLGQLVAGRPKGFIVAELVSNSWDEAGVTRVAVKVRRVTPRTWAVSVEDDAPEGFRDLRDAFTLFAPSGKKGDLGKRGRFNLGEKLVLALCSSAEIRTTIGGLRFDDAGRHTLRTKRERGSEFLGVLPMTLEEVAEMEGVFRQLLPPEAIETTFANEHSGERIVCAARPMLREFMSYLPTVQCRDDTGILRDTYATGHVRVYAAQPGGAWLYELGIPVTKLGDDEWDIDVRQKIPLSKERDTVRPNFLPAIRTAVLNEMHATLGVESAARTLVTEALGNYAVSTPAVRTMLDARFSARRVAYDPSDPEANMNATSKGYTVVHGGSLPGSVWDRARRDGLIPPAGQVCPTAKAHESPDGVPEIPEESRTDEMRLMVSRVSQIAERLLGKPMRVRVFDHPGLSFEGAYRPGVVAINLAAFDWHDTEKVLDLLLHELAHDAESNHLSEKYHMELTRLGARLALLAYWSSDLFAAWMPYRNFMLPSVVAQAVEIAADAVKP